VTLIDAPLTSIAFTVYGMAQPKGGLLRNLSE
jgi:hypothetical protein